MSHLNYYDAGQDSTPLPQYVEAREAKRKAFTAFWRGACFGAVLATGAFVASAAFSETISIGTLYTHGEAGNATTVTIEPSDVPGELAIVTLTNQYVNQGADNGDYSLTLDGMTVGVQFTWDHEPVLGSDRITLTPPDGITCEPADCGVTVMEGAVGSVVLFDYLGF
jgi:hypothetical protein